jgi:hypothetical protein
MLYVMRNPFVRLAALAVAGVLLIAAYHRTSTPTAMTLAAKQFLDSLSAEEKVKATFQFEDDERSNWFFTPVPRKGLPLREMSVAQQHLATALMAAGLSQQGIIKAETIMSMEDVLRAMEKDDGERRNPGKYYFSIFGTPSETGTWGYRVEGHHLSQNYTISNGHVVDAPSFFGSNPAEVREGPRKGVRLLAQEEDMGRALLMALDDSQRKIAIVEPNGYKEMLTSNSRKAALEGQPNGLSASKMTTKQMEMLTELVNAYADNVPEQLAAARMDLMKKTGKNVYFAWSGVAQKGGPHYYRIQAPTFLIEYDNTQNNANHIHTVWRDLTNDFGADLLKQHYAASHSK